MSEEYIKRSDALDAFGLSEETRKYGGDHSGYDMRMLYEIQDTIESIPSADVAEVRHGEWRTKSKTRMGSHGEAYFVYGCSLCKKQIKYKTDFCPNCGADMRGGT